MGSNVNGPFLTEKECKWALICTVSIILFLSIETVEEFLETKNSCDFHFYIPLSIH
jgi:hypothetical protein